jgi:hypothetical protein
MGVENFGDDSITGKRSTKRARVLIAAKIKTPAGEFEVRLRDLSRKGALIESGIVPPAGTKIQFTRGETCVPARVAWSSGHRIGLEFDYMIDEHEVFVQIGRGADAKPQQESFRRARLNGDTMSEYDKKLARDWGMAVGIDMPRE